MSNKILFNLSWFNWRLSVCFYPRIVKTATPIGSKICVAPYLTLGKVYGWLNFQKFDSKEIRFLKTLKIHNFLYKIREIFCLFYNWSLKIEIED